MNSTAWVQCVSVTIHNSAVQNSNHWLGFPTAPRMKGSSRVLVRTADVYVAQSTDNFQTSCWFDSFHFFALQPLPLYSGPGLSQPSPIKAVISCLSARLCLGMRNMMKAEFNANANRLLPTTHGPPCFCIFSSLLLLT